MRNLRPDTVYNLCKNFREPKQKNRNNYDGRNRQKNSGTRKCKFRNTNRDDKFVVHTEQEYAFTEKESLAQFFGNIPGLNGRSLVRQLRRTSTCVRYLQCSLEIGWLVSVPLKERLLAQKIDPRFRKWSDKKVFNQLLVKSTMRNQK